MNGPHRSLRLVALALVGPVLLAACSSSKSNTNSTAAGGGTTTTAPPFSNDWAIGYTGGTAGKADASQTPVLIGYVNQEGGVPGFPESTLAINAAVAYVNSELGGIKGHPVQLDKCIVQTEQDGQKCGTEFANNDKVTLVVTGVLAVGAQSLYQVVAGKKPVLVSNPLTTPDFLTKGVTAYTPGAPGVVKGMALFLAKNLQNVHKVAVIHGDDPAATFGAESLFKPLAVKLGVSDITLVKVSDTAQASQIQQNIQAAGADKADVLVPLVTPQLCTAVYDALQSLGITATVVTTGLCYDDGMTNHLKDLGSKDRVPNGWYFGGYGYSYFLPDKASGETTYLAKIYQYGPADGDYHGFAGPVFANLLTTVKFYNQVGPTATATALQSALSAFKGPMMLVAGAMSCGTVPIFVSLCGTQMGMQQYKDGKWISTADALSGSPIDTAGY